MAGISPGTQVPVNSRSFQSLLGSKVSTRSILCFVVLTDAYCRGHANEQKGLNTGISVREVSSF